jgi:hypothetical protein
MLDLSDMSFTCMRVSAVCILRSFETCLDFGQLVTAGGIQPGAGSVPPAGVIAAASGLALAANPESPIGSRDLIILKSANSSITEMTPTTYE